MKENFPSRMIAELKPLAARFLHDEAYHFLSKVADMLVGFSSGGWQKLGDDERYRYLEKLSDDFHPKAMGDSIYGNDPHYQKICEILYWEQQFHRRKRSK